MDIAASRGGDSVAVFYLARGADIDHLFRFRRFLRSYHGFGAGEDHTLMIIFKGFQDAAHLAEGRSVFRSLEYHPLFTDDNSFDLGAFFDAARRIPHERLCFLNSNCEINSEGWLAKLSANFAIPRVGIAGATGSFESLPSFPSFPNPHIRSNAFMMRRDVFLDVLSGANLTTKRDAYSVESGPAGLTRQVFERGLAALLVGRDGRGYTPYWWPHSQTFRQGAQSNLLVHDNHTRAFERMPFADKIHISQLTWGEYLGLGKHL